MDKIIVLLMAACTVMPAIASDGWRDSTEIPEIPLVRKFDVDAAAYLNGAHLREYAAQPGSSASNQKRKSPFLAGVLSFAVPGSGEIYSRNYWQGAVHIALEAAGWYFYIHNQSKGDNQTGVYKRYANTNWSVVKYAEWLNDYWRLESTFPVISIDPDESKLPWHRVDWSEINAFERLIREFSHTLEPYGTQQYFELIGKYPQYNRGWDDSHPYDDTATERVRYFDEISGNFSYYAGLRGMANTYYGRSHDFALVIFLNHFVSALHAAFLAHRFNETHLTVELEQHPAPFGIRTNPAVRLTIGF